MQLFKSLHRVTNSITLLHKLYISFGATLLVFSFVTFIYVNQSKTIRDEIYSLEQTGNIMHLSSGLEKAAIDQETGVRGFIVTQDPVFLEPYKKGQVEYGYLLAELKALVSDSIQVTRLHQIDSTYLKWKREFAEPSIQLKTAALASSENEAAFLEFFNSIIKKGKSKIVMDSYRDQITVFESHAQDTKTARMAKLQASIRFNNAVATALTLICVIAGILIAATVGSMFKRRMRQISTMAAEIAKGNFDAKIKSDSVDEISKVTNSLNLMADQLHGSFNNLNKLNKELDQFAYVVSHDLKAPLRAINSLAEWIEEDLPDVDADVKNNLKIMRGRVQRMDNLINGILSYARIGRKELPADTFSVRSLLEEISESLGLGTGTFIIEGKLPELKTEKILLHQVLGNLISNAIKYNDKPQPQVKIGCDSKESFYEFYVQDNGPGIPPEFHEKVFGVFQTMEARDTKESTGIGLAIVKKIVLEKGGDIFIDPNTTNGSRFVFTWPKKYVPALVHETQIA